MLQGRIIGILAVVALIAGYFAVDEFTTLTTKKLPPEQVMLQMVGAVYKVESLAYDGTITIDIDAKSRRGDNATFDLQVDFAHQTEMVQVHKWIPDTTGETRVTFDFAVPRDKEALSLTARMDHRSLDNVYFFRGIMEVLKQSQGISGFFPDSFDTGWIRFDYTEILMAVEEGGLSARDFQLTEAQQQRLFELVKAHPFITITKEFPIERTDGEYFLGFGGTKMYHFDYALDKSSLVMLLLGLQATIGPRGMPTLTEEDMTDLVNMFTVLDKFRGELWVGTEDFLPYRMTINFPFIEAIDGDLLIGSIRSDITFGDYNTPFDVKTPQTSVTLEAFMMNPVSQ